MNTIQTLEKLEDVLQIYVEELQGFSMEQLTQKPSENEWSLGQVYVHLIQSALYMQIRNIETCLTTNAENKVINEKTEAGKAVFELGSFPPIKIHVPPSPQYTPSQPTDKEQIVVGLQAVLDKLKDIQPQLDAYTSQNTVAHPRFGELNGNEWFLLVEMHFRHHRQQIERLKQGLGIESLN